jgi:queuosine precursor transporter
LTAPPLRPFLLSPFPLAGGITQGKKMLILRTTILYVALMTLVVVASNFLVQFPVLGSIAGIQLSDLLTWGAFIYPAAFLVTDLTNRQFGPKIARRVVFVGFLVGVTISLYTSMPRIAMASGTAYLVGQLVDISVFNTLRRQSWWRAPLAGSLFGSALDTVIFFSLSFAPVFAVLGANDDFAIGSAPILGVFASEAPRWISWAIGDFVVKLIVGLVMLLPYGALMSVVKPMPPAKAA